MIRKKVLNLILILLGTFILAVSVEMFILPYHILSGGVAGIAVAVEPFFHIDETLFANCMILALFFLGWIFLGRQFAVNTAVSSLFYPVFTTLLSRCALETDIDPVLASFYAGLLGGFGIGLVMRTGASTGGMDVPPLILNRLTGIKISTLVMIVDGLTVLLGIIAYDINAALIGLVSVFASGFAIARVLEAGRGVAAKKVQIISDNWQAIADSIKFRLNRGLTIIDVTGGYSGEPKKMILVVVYERQYNELLEIIRENDEKAFVITTDSSDMVGEGFTYTSPNI
ncbi:MAG: YitT family protein [Erysipelotrichaceae bacterium]|nr:YitT family protein [Erysipelotrichaceae bacterium]